MIIPEIFLDLIKFIKKKVFNKKASGERVRTSDL